MKHKILLILSSAMITIFCGCTKTETPKTTNPYNDTVWTDYHTASNALKHDAYLDVISFRNSEFEYYKEDTEGNFIETYARGAYTYNGNSIYINNVNYNDYYYITGATVSENSLTLHRYFYLGSSDDSKFDCDRVFRKKN